MSDYIEFKQVECLRATAKAIFVRSKQLRDIWFPQGIVYADSEIWKPGDRGTLRIAAWWAAREGWI